METNINLDFLDENELSSDEDVKVIPRFEKT